MSTYALDPRRFRASEAALKALRLGRQHGDSKIEPALAEETASFYRNMGIHKQFIDIGEQTSLVASRKVKEDVVTLKKFLESQVASARSTPQQLSDNLRRAYDTRLSAKEKANSDPVALQRETLKAIRDMVTEQQIAGRAESFRKATTTQGIGGGTAVDIDKLFSFHDSSERRRDEAGTAWAKRELERVRELYPAPELGPRFDAALQAPSDVVPSTVAEAIASHRNGTITLPQLIDLAERGDASAGVACWAILKQLPEDHIDRNSGLLSLQRLPEAALEFAIGAESQLADEEEAHARALIEHAVIQAEDAATRLAVYVPQPPVDPRGRMAAGRDVEEHTPHPLSQAIASVAAGPPSYTA
jgi:hypothetical protein